MQQITIWFNRTFSHVRPAIELIHAADTEQRFRTICSHENPNFPGFSAASYSEREPADLDSDAYVDYCLDFCQRNQVDIFYPGRGAGAIALRRAEFAALNTRLILVADDAALTALEEKAQFYLDQANAEVSGPETIMVQSYAEYQQAHATLRSRHAALCIKPSVGVYGIGFRIIDERRKALDHILKGIDFHVASTDLDRELSSMQRFKPLLVMEYLSGHEYSVDCLASDGRLLVAVARRKERSTGAGQTIVDDPLIVRACERLALEYGLNAIFNVQFKEDGEGRLRVLEINARMSGGSAMACLAGPNLPHLAVLDALGELDQQHIPAVKHGLRVGEYRQAVVLPEAQSA